MAAQSLKVTSDELTEVQSQTYLRNMLRASFSSILYLRGIFDESHFTDRSLCGVNIKALIPLDGSAKTFTQWIEAGVFDALQKRYLKSIVLAIYQDAKREDTLVETYQFSIAYTSSNGIAIDLLQSSFQRPGVAAHERQHSVVPRSTSRQEIKDATISLLRRLITLTQTLSPLPATRDLVMKLQYYQDVTPEDYTPTHFSSSFVPSFAPPMELERIQVGSIETPHHALSFCVLSAPCNASTIADHTTRGPGSSEMDTDTGFDPNASVYSVATYGTTSEAVDESDMMTSISQSSSSQVTAPHSSQRRSRLAIGPFRQLLAERERVTLDELKVMLSRVGMRASDAAVVQILHELQNMGFLGPQTRGGGYPILH